jgi:hypothetical protein
VQLLALQYPADQLVLDMHQHERRESSEAGTRPESMDEEPYMPLRLRKRPIWLAIHRADLSLYYKRLTRPEYLTLCALRDDHTLAQALEAGFTGSRLAIGEQLNLVKQWFATWSQLGWICRQQ